MIENIQPLKIWIDFIFKQRTLEWINLPPFKVSGRPHPDLKYVYMDKDGIVQYGYADRNYFDSLPYPEYQFTSRSVFPIPVTPEVKTTPAESRPIPHVHAVHIKDWADNPRGTWQYSRGWEPDVWYDCEGSIPNWDPTCCYRRKPEELERRFPVTSISGSNLALIYHADPGTQTSKLLAVANKAIKQYILDKEATEAMIKEGRFPE